MLDLLGGADSAIEGFPKKGEGEPDDESDHRRKEGRSFRCRRNLDAVLGGLEDDVPRLEQLHRSELRSFSTRALVEVGRSSPTLADAGDLGGQLARASAIVDVSSLSLYWANAMRNHSRDRRDARVTVLHRELQHVGVRPWGLRQQLSRNAAGDMPGTPEARVARLAT